MSVRRTGGGRPTGGSSPVSGTGKSAPAKGAEGAESASGAAQSIRIGAAELIKQINRTGATGFDRHRQELAQGVMKYFGEMLENDPEVFKKVIAGAREEEDSEEEEDDEDSATKEKDSEEI